MQFIVAASSTRYQTMRLLFILAICTGVSAPSMTSAAEVAIPVFSPRALCDSMGARSNLAGKPKVKDFIKACINWEGEALAELKLSYHTYRQDLYKECVHFVKMSSYCIGFKSGSYDVLVKCLKKGEMPDEIWHHTSCEPGEPGETNKVYFNKPSATNPGATNPGGTNPGGSRNR